VTSNYDDYSPWEPTLIMRDPSLGFIKDNILWASQLAADLMNDEISLEQAQQFSQRVRAGNETDDDKARIERFCARSGFTATVVREMLRTPHDAQEENRPGPAEEVEQEAVAEHESQRDGGLGLDEDEEAGEPIELRHYDRDIRAGLVHIAAAIGSLVWLVNEKAYEGREVTAADVLVTLKDWVD
jgi:hypothetical protein